MSTDPQTIPLNQARRRIHAAAMKLFAERGVTKVTISELASAAGMARGTIYSHVPDVDSLFEDVAAQLAREMIERVVAGFAGLADPPQRLAIGVRQYIRRAHEEPLWGRFMSRFGMSPALTQALHGTGPFSGQGANHQLRSLFRLYQESLTLLAAPDSGITTLADIEGKRVYPGNSGAGEQFTSQALMAVMGWQPGQFVAYQLKSNSEPLEGLCDGSLDAAFVVAGHPSLAVGDLISSEGGDV